MTPEELQTVNAQVRAQVERADAAERRAEAAERERDALRALLSRLRTSLAESFNDPANAA
jgi:hypothetical protein